MAISVGAACVVVLVGGQFVVPPIATMVLRHRLAKDGRVISVRVSAFPWFQLLWQHADKVTARMANYTAPPEDVKDQLQEAAGVGTIEISIGVLHTGLLTLRDVNLTKHGRELVGAARLELRDLQAALPIVQALSPVHEAGGQVVLRGKASVLGVSATVDVLVAARDGTLVVAPTGLIGGFATLTVYDDPEIRVRAVEASTVPGGVRFVARGRLR